MSNVTRMPNVSPQNWPQQNWSGSWSGCSCGCNPCQCGGGFGGLMQCWQDISQFQQFLMAMLSQMGPYPVQGVTDGSDAKPGNIGEFVKFNGTLSFLSTSAVQTISLGVLSPGDWDLWGFAGGWSVPVNESEIYLSPTPTGFSNNMIGFMLGEWMPLMNARASIIVPTLLAFSSNVVGTSAAGTGTISVEARRRR
jgi:hypothetical protein